MALILIYSFSFNGERKMSRQFLEATLYVMLFKMRDKSAIIQLEVRTKFCIPKDDDFG